MLVLWPIATLITPHRRHGTTAAEAVIQPGALYGSSIAAPDIVVSILTLVITGLTTMVSSSVINPGYQRKAALHSDSGQQVLAGRIFGHTVIGF